MKAPIRQVLLHTSLFIVQFSKRYLKAAPNGRMCDFCEISFKRSINQLLEYRDLTKFMAAKLLTNFTFALQRIPELQFLIIFCYTESLFPRHSESDRTLFQNKPLQNQPFRLAPRVLRPDNGYCSKAKLLTNYILSYSGGSLDGNF